MKFTYFACDTLFLAPFLRNIKSPHQIQFKGQTYLKDDLTEVGAREHFSVTLVLTWHRVSDGIHLE